MAKTDRPPPYCPWFDWEVAMFIEALEWQDLAWRPPEQAVWDKQTPRIYPPGFHFAQAVRMIVQTGWRVDQVESLRWGTPTPGWEYLPAREQRHGFVDTRSQLIFPLNQKDGDQVRFPYDKFEPVAEIIADQLEWRQHQNFDADVFVFRRPAAYLKGNRLAARGRTLVYAA